MKNVSKIILCILFIFNTFISLAQTLECKMLEFYFNPSIEFGLKVKATLEIDNLKNDTATLKTNVKFSTLGPKDLKASLVKKDGSLYPLPSWIDEQINTEQSGIFQYLRFLIPNREKATVQITYNVTGSTIFKYKPDSEDFYALQQCVEYYYPMDILIREITVSSLDTIKYFISYKEVNKRIKDINVAFINENKYNKKSVIKDNLNINLYIPDSLVNNKRMQQNIMDMQQYIDRFSIYLPSRKSSDIIYINWRDDKERRAFGEGLGNYAVCDINFGSKDLLHELIHTLLPVNVEQHSKGEYFIGESIIEWLALFLADKSLSENVNNMNGTINLYDAQINNYTTWNLIYTTGPLIIQHISSKCGKEKMANIIISFLERNQNKEINYDMFIAYVKKCLSNDLGKEMDFLIKTSY
jgi:hypothetical protein